MTNSIQERADRRIIILKGMNEGLSREKIAEGLGVSPVVVRRDVSRMRRIRDPDLRKASRNAEEMSDKAKEAQSNLANERFKESTGMTFKEKTFNNMMTFYGPEIKKILRSNKEIIEIRKLPHSTLKALKRNGIIAQGWKTPAITDKAKRHLANARISN